MVSHASAEPKTERHSLSRWWSQVEALVKRLRSVNTTARVLRSVRSRVELRDVINIRAFDLDKVPLLPPPLPPPPRLRRVHPHPPLPGNSPLPAPRPRPTPTPTATATTSQSHRFMACHLFHAASHKPVRVVV